MMAAQQRTEVSRAACAVGVWMWCACSGFDQFCYHDRWTLNPYSYPTNVLQDQIEGV